MECSCYNRGDVKLFDDAVTQSVVSLFGVFRMSLFLYKSTAFCAYVLGQSDCEQTAAVLIAYVGLLSHTEDGKKIRF